MVQGIVHSGLARVDSSYCMGDVMIASTAVIGMGVVLRADPGCSITIRDGVCLGNGVTIHATQGAIELHQGACIAGGVLIVGKGQLGKHVCVGTGSTLINPILEDGTLISAHCLWGDTSRPPESQAEGDRSNGLPSPGSHESQSATQSSSCGLSDGLHSNAEVAQSVSAFVQKRGSNDEPDSDLRSPKGGSAPESMNGQVKPVIGKQEFEKMLQKMFPERQNFQKSL